MKKLIGVGLLAILASCSKNKNRNEDLLDLLENIKGQKLDVLTREDPLGSGSYHYYARANNSPSSFAVYFDSKKIDVEYEYGKEALIIYLPGTIKKARAVSIEVKYSDGSGEKIEVELTN